MYIPEALTSTALSNHKKYSFMLLQLGGGRVRVCEEHKGSVMYFACQKDEAPRSLQKDQASRRPHQPQIILNCRRTRSLQAHVSLTPEQLKSTNTTTQWIRNESSCRLYANRQNKSSPHTQLKQVENKLYQRDPA